MKKTKQQYIDAITLGIDNIAGIILDYETSGLYDSNTYTKYNMSDALLIAMHIVGTIGIEHNQNRYTNEECMQKSEELGKGLRKLVLEYTGIDTHKIYTK